MLTLLGVAVIVLGFALRFNPLLVVIAAAMTSGLAAGLSPVEVLAAFGKAFNTNRYVSVAWLVLPAIGVLERAGLKERRVRRSRTCGRPRRVGSCWPTSLCARSRPPWASPR
jgi:uncharacterized membrane protein